MSDSTLPSSRLALSPPDTENGHDTKQGEEGARPEYEGDTERLVDHEIRRSRHIATQRAEMSLDLEQVVGWKRRISSHAAGAPTVEECHSGWLSRPDRTPRR